MGNAGFVSSTVGHSTESISFHLEGLGVEFRFRVYSRSPKVGNPMASILKSSVYGIPALFVLNPVSNFLGLTIGV